MHQLRLSEMTETQTQTKKKIRFSISKIGLNDSADPIYSLNFGGIAITFDSVSFDMNDNQKDLIYLHRRVAGQKFGLTTGAIPKRWFDEKEIEMLSKWKQEVQ